LAEKELEKRGGYAGEQPRSLGGALGSAETAHHDMEKGAWTCGQSLQQSL